MAVLHAQRKRAAALSFHGAYWPRQPRTSPLWRCLVAYFDEFLALYPERYEARLGGLRAVVKHVVEKFMVCGDLTHGFARIHCRFCRCDI